MESCVTTNVGRKVSPAQNIARPVQLCFWRGDADMNSDQKTCSNLRKGNLILPSTFYPTFYLRRAFVTFD